MPYVVPSAVETSMYSRGVCSLTPDRARLRWGEQHGLEKPPAFTPTLILPGLRGRERLTDVGPENCMTLGL